MGWPRWAARRDSSSTHPRRDTVPSRSGFIPACRSRTFRTWAPSRMQSRSPSDHARCSRGTSGRWMACRALVPWSSRRRTLVIATDSARRCCAVISQSMSRGSAPRGCASSDGSTPTRPTTCTCSATMHGPSLRVLLLRIVSAALYHARSQRHPGPAALQSDTFPTARPAPQR